ncbi:MAG: transglycosylase domain-containing protein [Firmicutes bacterium]|nr:transglycosylase domain-containing protein [Bacillota bacterium]MBR2576213.1 transglycosylase domain-containing protein [Bacillota bacterium]
MLKKIAKFFIKLIIVLLTLALIGLAAVAGWYFYSGYNLYKTTLENEDLISRVDKVEWSEDYIPLQYVSDYFQDAIVAVEDPHFYEHDGFNLKAIIRALKADIEKKEYAQGGSTITQQVAKNLCFSGEKTISRKVAELLVARDLEKLYTKDEILELYVNVIYYGDGYTGIGPASWGYYGISPMDMDFKQSTLLAGVPQAPSRYSLTKHLDNAIQRQKVVVQAMINNGMVSEEEVAEMLSAQ